MIEYLEVAASFDHQGERQQRAMLSLHETWNAVADGTPNPLPWLEDLVGNPDPERLRQAAEVALKVFAKRGKPPDD